MQLEYMRLVINILKHTRKEMKSKNDIKRETNNILIIWNETKKMPRSDVAPLPEDILQMLHQKDFVAIYKEENFHQILDHCNKRLMKQILETINKP